MAIQMSAQEFISGISALIFIVISVIVGIRLLTKYKTHKQNAFIFAGIAWIGISTPWTSNATEFLSVLILGNPLSETAYLFLSYFWIPIPLFFWVTLYMILKHPKNQKIVTIILLIQWIIYDTVFLYFTLTNVSVIGTKVGLFDDELNLPFLLYVLIVLIIALITGISVGLESMKSEQPEIRLKGKFLIIAWISFFITGLLDAGLFSLTTLLLILVRLGLISSAIEFYFGFFLPNWLKKRLIKEA